MNTLKHLSVLADTESVRSKDDYGRLHISRAKITAPTVDTYAISELPLSHRALLQTNKPTLKLYRDRSALADAAHKYANLPLYFNHTFGKDIDRDRIIGTVGSNIIVDSVDGSIWADLCLWDEEAIHLVEMGDTVQLSGGYGYEIDPTPGTVDNVEYDAKILVTAPNHLALVKRGRAGPTVKIGDSEMDKTTALLGIKFDKTDVTADNRAALIEYRKLLTAAIGDAESLAEEGDDYETLEDAEFDKKMCAMTKEKEKRDAKKAKDKPSVGDAATLQAAIDALAAQHKADLAARDAAALAKHKAALITRDVIGDMALDTAEHYYRKALDTLKVPHADIREVSALESLYGVAATLKNSSVVKNAIGDSSLASNSKVSLDLDHIRVSY